MSVQVMRCYSTIVDLDTYLTLDLWEQEYFGKGIRDVRPDFEES